MEIPSDEDIARAIARGHGSKMVLRRDGVAHTVASLKGYGQFAEASEKYADKHWQEYVLSAQLAKQMLLPKPDGDDDLQK